MSVCSRTLSNARRVQSKSTIQNVLLIQQNRSYATANPIAKHNEKLRPLVEQDVLAPITFPRQRPGLEYELNWSLIPLQITPYNDAFRNAATKHLIQRAYGKLTKNKALIVDAFPTSEYQQLITFQAEELETNWKLFSPKFHRRVQREVAYYLTHVPSSFVQDGDFGHGIKIRVITDNGTSGLLLKNLILPTRPVSAKSFKYDGLVFHAPGYEFVPSNIVEEYNGPKPSDLGLTTDKFIMSNERDNRITIGGVSDSNLLIDSIVYAANKAALAKGSVVIPSDSVISNDGKITLIVNNDGDDATNIRKSVLSNIKTKVGLYGAQHNLLSAEGLSRVWGGIRTVVDSDTYNKLTLKLGDLVERIDGGKKYIITSKDTAKPNIIKKPTSIVFLVKDATNAVPSLGKISAETAKTLLVSGKSNFPATDINTAQTLFGELTSGAQFYVANSSDSKALYSALETVTTGDASKSASADAAVSKFLGK